MHFSISDTEELLDAYGSSYTSYRLHCNGTYHGTARYREFSDLHDSLRPVFPDLPSFPPKRLFNLSVAELSGRRQALEKYMQNLGQSAEILRSSIFHDFLRRIQLRCIEEFEPGPQSICLLNGNEIKLVCDPKVNGDELLEIVSRELKLPADLTTFFGLFLALEQDGKYRMLKRFASFEIPFAVVYINSSLGITGYLSRKHSSGMTNGNAHLTHDHNLRILLRKNYWDPTFDTDILESPSRVGTNLLFVEAVDAINRGWMHPTPEQKMHLENLQQKGSRKEFVQVCQTVKGYGSLHFDSSTIDYPAPETTTRPYLTGRDLVCPLKMDGQVKQEAVFRVIRMRCWRLCVSETYKNGHSAEHPHSARMSIMFEYLLGRDRLQWITIFSEEAVWMSSCLRSMVEELMLQKRGLKVNKPLPEPVKRSDTSESLSVSVTVTRNMTTENTAFEEIRDEDL